MSRNGGDPYEMAMLCYVDDSSCLVLLYTSDYPGMLHVAGLIYSTRLTPISHAPAGLFAGGELASK